MVHDTANEVLKAGLGYLQQLAPMLQEEPPEVERKKEAAAQVALCLSLYSLGLSSVQVL